MKNTTTARRLLAGAAAALCLAVGVGPAGATGNSVTVAVGGTSAQALHPVTAMTMGSVSWAVPTLALGCSGARIPANPVSAVRGGTGVTEVLDLRAMQFIGCSWPGGAFTTTLPAPSALHVTAPVSGGSVDVVRGHLGNFSITMSNAVCDFTATGSARVTFNESTQQLAIEETGFTGNLTISNVRGCLGQVRNGQAMNLTMNLQVTSPNGAINIS